MTTIHCLYWNRVEAMQLAPSKRKLLEEFTVLNLNCTFAIIPNHYTWLDEKSKVLRLKESKAERYSQNRVNAYLVKTAEDTYVSLAASAHPKDEFIDFILSGMSQDALDTVLSRYYDALQNPAAFRIAAETKKAEETALYRKEEAERKAKRAEWEAEQAAANEAKLQEAIKAFVAGTPIAWDMFEILLKRFDVSVHSRTLGSGRRTVGTISPKRGTAVKGKIADGIWEAANTLYSAITEQEDHTHDPEIDRLFVVNA